MCGAVLGSRLFREGRVLWPSDSALGCERGRSRSGGAGATGIRLDGRRVLVLAGLDDDQAFTEKLAAMGCVAIGISRFEEGGGLAEAVRRAEVDEGPLDGMVVVLGPHPLCSGGRSAGNREKQVDLRAADIATQALASTFEAVGRRASVVYACMSADGRAGLAPIADLTEQLRQMAANPSAAGIRVNAVTGKLLGGGVDPIEAMAQTTAFLLSDLSRFLTGQVLSVCGGICAEQSD